MSLLFVLVVMTVYLPFSPFDDPCIGLINEIMSKGRRMTYEELCNAVLPVCLLQLFSVYIFLCLWKELIFSYSFSLIIFFFPLSWQHWPHLRKHNGERYAYSSHSQAVLDCLRNRHEWSRLVDRGPKVLMNYCLQLFGDFTCISLLGMQMIPNCRLKSLYSSIGKDCCMVPTTKHNYWSLTVLHAAEKGKKNSLT